MGGEITERTIQADLDVFGGQEMSGKLAAVLP
jgi:hypothetical protein